MDILQFLHIGILFYLVLGWMTNNITLLYCHLIFCILILVQWWVNDNKCILTEIQQKSGSLEPDQSFTSSLFPFLSDKQLNILNYIVVMSAASLSIYKIF